jgi:tRNA 2-thiouridine synthesizing protein E
LWLVHQSHRQQEDYIMLDINNAIKNGPHSETDPEGNMFDLQHWSPLVAKLLAGKEDIMLSDKHWEIIIYLRERYRVHGMAHSARELLKELEEEFCDGRGRKELYELFPGGPVSQASRIAGLPLPPYSSDRSFGSVE